MASLSYSDYQSRNVAKDYDEILAPYGMNSPQNHKNYEQNRQEDIGSGTPNMLEYKNNEIVENHTYQQRPTNQTTQGQRILTFIGCALMIYLCQVINGVIQQRIYKVPYKNTNKTSQFDYYTDALTPMFFSAFFAAAIGYAKLDDNQLQLEIPWKKLLKLAVLQILIHFSLMWALMNASYVLVVMVNSCGLLSVILVGVYYSNINRQRQYEPNNQQIQGQRQTNNLINNSQNSHNNGNNQLGPQKILICVIVCTGIFIFNFFTPKNTSHSTHSAVGLSQGNNNSIANANDSTAQSASLLTFAVLIFAIVLEGFRPEVQTRIKQQYQPSPIGFYFHYNKVLCVLVLILSAITLQFNYTISFIINHDQLFFHIIIMSLLNAFAALFIYKIITLFRQHVYPLVSTVRKCITVGVSILYFGHYITFLQFVGIILVFGGVMLEISLNYNLLQKWDINLPFTQQQKNQRYVKNKLYGDRQKQNVGNIKKKYQVYKIIDKQGDIEGI